MEDGFALKVTTNADIMVKEVEDVMYVVGCHLYLYEKNVEKLCGDGRGEQKATPAGLRY